MDFLNLEIYTLGVFRSATHEKTVPKGKMANAERNDDLNRLEIAVNQRIHYIFDAMRAGDMDAAMVLMTDLSEYMNDEFEYSRLRYGEGPAAAGAAEPYGRPLNEAEIAAVEAEFADPAPEAAAPAPEAEPLRALRMGHTFYDWGDMASSSASAGSSDEGRIP